MSLCLTRTDGESVIIGEGDSMILITVHARAGRKRSDQVTLSIDAPDDVRILRAELAHKYPAKTQTSGLISQAAAHEGATA
jgi:sRNA-binding carbon storage regulator CsrA